MPRGVVVLVALALVAANGGAAGSAAALPPGFSIVASATLYSGVDYVKLAKTTSPVVAAHIAHVAPGAPVDLRVVNANDKISTSARELETTSSMCRRVRCVVGVNGDFNTLGTPAGAVVAGRTMLHSPDPSRPQLTMTATAASSPARSPGREPSAPTGPRCRHHGQRCAAARRAGRCTHPRTGRARRRPGRTELVVRATGASGCSTGPPTWSSAASAPGPGPYRRTARSSPRRGGGQQLREIWARRKPGRRPPRS